MRQMGRYVERGGKFGKSKNLLAVPKWPLTPSRPERFSKTLHYLRKASSNKKSFTGLTRILTFSGEATYKTELTFAF